MARKPRLGQRAWRFSDSGNKFDGRRRPARHSDIKPISPALKRGVIRCSRCGSRVVSNVDNCPFCGRSLRPFYARFWFWLIVVIAVGTFVVWAVNNYLPEENISPTSPARPERPQVIGGIEGSSIKNLPLGTGVDNSGLEVTVTSVDLGPVAANGSQVYIVNIEFNNTTNEVRILYTLQWMLQTSYGTRLDTFVGYTSDGSSISSNFEATELAGGARFSGWLAFALATPAATEEEAAAGITPEAPTPSAVIYQPSALYYDEDLSVTWRVSE